MEGRRIDATASTIRVEIQRDDLVEAERDHPLQRDDRDREENNLLEGLIRDRRELKEAVAGALALQHAPHLTAAGLQDVGCAALLAAVAVHESGIRQPCGTIRPLLRRHPPAGVVHAAVIEALGLEGRARRGGALDELDVVGPAGRRPQSPGWPSHAPLAYPPQRSPHPAQRPADRDRHPRIPVHRHENQAKSPRHRDPVWRGRRGRAVR